MIVNNMNSTNMQDIKSPKFILIVETATDLFMKYGVKRVTVEEICRTAKVSKMTFYSYFKNKIELAEHIIFSIMDKAQLEFDSIWKQLSTFDHKIEQFIKLKMVYAKKFSKEFFIDFMSLSPNIREKILEYTQRNQINFIKMVEQAQKSGSVRQDVSINLMSFIMNKFLEFSEDKDFQALYSNTEELTWDVVNFYFYGIMGKKK